MQNSKKNSAASTIKTPSRLYALLDTNGVFRGVDEKRKNLASILDDGQRIVTYQVVERANAKRIAA